MLDRRGAEVKHKTSEQQGNTRAEGHAAAHSAIALADCRIL